MARTKSEPQVKISVVTKTQTTKGNDLVISLHDLNAYLNLETSVIMEDFVHRFSNRIPHPVFQNERLHNTTLSRSQYRVTSFINFGPHKYTIPSLIEYAYGLKRNFCTLQV